MVRLEISRFILEVAARAHQGAAAPSGLYFRGYPIIGACSLIQFLFLGALFSYGVLFPTLEAEFGWSRTALSGASSASFLLMGVLAIAMGKINDILGPRLLLSVTGALYGLGYLFLAQMESIWTLYLCFSLLVGIGMAAHDVGTLSTATRWFVTRRGMMTGVVKAGAGMGQLLMPLALAALVATYDWRTACLVIGVMVIIVSVLAAQILRRDPASIGQEAHGAHAASTPTQEYGLNLRQAARMQRFWLLCLAKFAGLFCLLTVIVHIVPYGIDQGLAAKTAAQVLATIGGASIFGRLAVGSAYDRCGGKLTLMACFSLLFLSLLLLQLSVNPSMLFLFGAIYGFAHGGFFTVASPCVAEYFGTRSHGAILGAVFLSGSLGGTFGPILAGHWFDTMGSYSLAFIVLTGASVGGFLVAWILPSTIYAKKA